MKLQDLLEKIVTFFKHTEHPERTDKEYSLRHERISALDVPYSVFLVVKKYGWDGFFYKCVLIAKERSGKIGKKMNKVKYVLFSPSRAFQKHKQRIYFAIFHPVKFLTKYLWRRPEKEGLYLDIVLKLGSLKSGQQLWRAASGCRFQEYAQPLVSVVIPVYGQIAVTIRCLESIAKHVPNASFEIIIVNDKSTDSSKKVLEKVRGIRLITNKENIGFIRSCNAGARAVKGEYLYFLNNDVEVTPDWMDSLLRMFTEHSDVGLVGSKLVYPDGKLQEAGGIVWKDGSAWNYGRGENPGLPRFNYVRETDYCSGASIMVPKSLFDEIGGFDERYIPAYYEDSDLCFEIRKRGKKVMYQPTSTIVHYEGISNGKDVSSGVKAYQVANAEKFYAKWKETLEKENLENGKDVFLARERNRSKKTVLVIDHYVPTFDKDAGSKSMYQYIKLLCKLGYNVKFIGDNFAVMEPYTTALQQMGVEVLYGLYLKNNWRLWLKNYGQYIDFVLISRPHIFEKYIDSIRTYTHARVIFYGHDLHHLRTRREYEITKNKSFLKESNNWKHREFEIINEADMSLYPSCVEIDLIRKADPDARVELLPLYMYDEQAFLYEAKNRENLLFVGGFNHAPNKDAMIWFANEIFPRIRENHPAVKLYIVGSNASKEILDLASESIIVKGYISDKELESLYKKVRLTVAPLRYGAGMKGKILESLYRGVPVVTTSCGAEGINKNLEILLWTDTEEGFVDVISKSYDDADLLNRISKNGKSYIAESFSINSAAIQIRRLFTHASD